MGVAFSVVDVLVEPAGMNRLKQLGATSVPVVVVGDDFAYGLDTDKLGQLLGKGDGERALKSAIIDVGGEPNEPTKGNSTLD